jgi:hypothetical protein
MRPQPMCRPNPLHAAMARTRSMVAGAGLPAERVAFCKTSNASAHKPRLPVPVCPSLVCRWVAMVLVPSAHNTRPPTYASAGRPLPDSGLQPPAVAGRSRTAMPLFIPPGSQIGEPTGAIRQRQSARTGPYPAARGLVRRARPVANVVAG